MVALIQIGMTYNMTNDRHRRLRKQDLSNVNRSYSLDNYDDVDDNYDEGDDVYSFHQGSATNAPKRSCHLASSRSVTATSSTFRSNAQLRNHAEVERYRRRSLAIMYELIRLCLTEEDLKNCESDVKNSLENISYLEILHISCRKFEEAVRDIIHTNHVMRNIRKLENMQRRLNMPSRIKRPGVISLKFHRKLCQMVGNIVRTDARLMERDGRRLRTPREVALEARKALESLVMKATAMHDAEDTTNVPSFADYNAPTGATSNQPETNTGARADVPHSSSCHPQPPPTTNSPPFAKPFLESGIYHSNSNHTVQSPRDSINPVENEFVFNESPNHDPRLTSKPSHHSTNASQEGDINFVEEHNIEHKDNSTDANELLAALVRDFGLDINPVEIIVDPDFYSNLEIPDVEAEEEMLNL